MRRRSANGGRAGRTPGSPPSPDGAGTSCSTSMVARRCLRPSDWVCSRNHAGGGDWPRGGTAPLVSAPRLRGGQQSRRPHAYRHSRRQRIRRVAAFNPPERKAVRWRGADGENALALPLWRSRSCAASTSMRAGGTQPIGGARPPVLLKRIPKGQRNDALTSEAGRIARTARDGEGVERKLTAWNLDRCETPSPEREVRGIAKRIWEKEQRGRAKGGRNRRRSSGPEVRWAMRSTDYACREPHALDDLGHLLDLARLIVCNEEMPIETGHGRVRSAWVADGEAEIAARFLENRWGWGRKRLRIALHRWRERELIELVPPFKHGSYTRVRVTGWVRCDSAWGQARRSQGLTSWKLQAQHGQWGRGTADKSRG